VHITEIEGDEAVNCATCDVELTTAEIDDCGEQCRACYAKEHFTCRDCSDEFETADCSATCKTRCQPCQDDKNETETAERLDALRAELTELVEAIVEDSGDADEDEKHLRAAIKALKRIVD
jgi:hypothetical protein